MRQHFTRTSPDRSTTLSALLIAASCLGLAGGMTAVEAHAADHPVRQDGTEQADAGTEQKGADAEKKKRAAAEKDAEGARKEALKKAEVLKKEARKKEAPKKGAQKKEAQKTERKYCIQEC